MHPVRLLGTTAFRVALANTAASALIILLVLAALYPVSRDHVLAQLDSDLAGDRQALLASVRDGGMPALVDAVARRVEANGGSAFYLLVSAEGQKLAGNLPLVPVPLGAAWITVPASASNLDEGLLRADGSVLPDGELLLVGRDPQRLDDLHEVFMTALIATEIGTVVLGLLIGTFISHRVLRGVETISREAGRIGDGDLGRRIPLVGGGPEISRIGAAINAMLDRIAVLTASLRQVTDDIAHDLRTPLSRLRQNLERASLNGGGAELGPAVDRALDDADAIIATFNAMLRIAQIEAFDRRRGFINLDLSLLLRRLAEVYAPSAEEAGRRLEIAIAPAVHVMGDVDLLGQMVSNLIENALRHTGAATMVALTLEAEPAPTLTVADDGPGIAPHQRPRVLERFVRLDESRGTAGTGLGLALVKAVADLHGARLTLADNHPGLRAIVAFGDPDADDTSGADSAWSTAGRSVVSEAVPVR